MGFNPPVPQNDSDWEIRVAVLLSLLLQILLIFMGPMRKRTSHPFPSFLIWSCYLLADWVADLALGLMLNNMGNIGGGINSTSSSFGSSKKHSGDGGVTTGNNNNGSPIIFVFWAPFLLLHLGGPDTITAYSLEDNELWLRHLIGLLFELFSALVVFGCSLRGNPMILATVLMFVVGIVKYGERTCSLYSGSVEGFRENIGGPLNPGPNYARLMTEFSSKKNAGLPTELGIEDNSPEARRALEAKHRAREEAVQEEVKRRTWEEAKRQESEEWKEAKLEEPKRREAVKLREEERRAWEEAQRRMREVTEFEEAKYRAWEESEEGKEANRRVQEAVKRRMWEEANLRASEAAEREKASELEEANLRASEAAEREKASKLEEAKRRAWEETKEGRAWVESEEGKEAKHRVREAKEREAVKRHAFKEANLRAWEAVEREKMKRQKAALLEEAKRRAWEEAERRARTAAELEEETRHAWEQAKRLAQEAAEWEEAKGLALKCEKSMEAMAYDLFLIFRRLFANLKLSFKERMLSQAFFLDRFDPSKAFEMIELELNFTYDMVYTKVPVSHSRKGWLLRALCSFCLVATLVIFFLLNKAQHGINRVDIGITYALLLGGLALEVAALLMLLFSNHVMVQLENSSLRLLRWLARLTRMVPRPRRWAMKTSQLNLISYSLGKPDHYRTKGWRWLLNKATKFLRVEEMVDDSLFIRHKPVDPPTVAQHGLLHFIFDVLKKDAEKLQGKSVEEIMQACGRRGTHVLQIYENEIKDTLREKHKYNIRDALRVTEYEINMEVQDKFKLLRDSVSVEKTEFDKSLLLWHIATDLCRCRKRQDQPGSAEWVTPSGPPTQNTTWMPGFGETLSEYMLYLLLKHPEMLPATGGGIDLLYRDTCAEARRFFGSMAAAPWNPNPTDSRLFEDDARRMLLGINTSKNPADIKGDLSKSVLFDAVILAKILRELDEDLMWTIVTGVWLEMLTYVASRCRGSTQVRQLSRGGELITLVWLLMAHMGLSDMYEFRAGEGRAKLVVIDW